MNKDLFGYNEEVMNKTILDIYDYKERILKILNQISETMELSKKYYQSIDADELKSKFDKFQTNFKIVANNIDTYADDLLAVKQRNKNFEQDAKAEIKLRTIKIEETGGVK